MWSQKMLFEKRKNYIFKYGNDYYKTQFGITKLEKCSLVAAAKCTYYRWEISDCKNYSSKLYGLLSGLLVKSSGDNPLPIRSSDFQLANELSEYILLKTKRLCDMFVTTRPSKSQLIPDSPFLSLTSFAEIKRKSFFA